MCAAAPADTPGRPAVRGHAECRLRRRSGDRLDRHTCGAADNGPGDSSANGSSRDDSCASEAARSDSDGATTGTGTDADADADADAGRSVGGRSCGAGPSSDDGAAETGSGTGAGAQEGAGNTAALPFNFRGRCIRMWRCCSTNGRMVLRGTR